MLKIKRNKILDHLHNKEMTIKELAQKTKVSEKTIYNLITKKNTPKVSLAMTIARIFGKTISEIFEFEEE